MVKVDMRNKHTNPPTHLFNGEMMTCVMCGKQEHSDPDRESDWRAVEFGGVVYYVCPAHFPDDRTATRWAYRQAYEAVFRKILGGKSDNGL